MKTSHRLKNVVKTHILGKNIFRIYNSSVQFSSVAQSCLTLCDPMDYPVHGILQARMLEWVAFPFSGDLPNPGIKPLQPGLPHCRQILYQLNHKGRWRHVGSIPWLRIPWTEEPGISKSRTWLKQLNMHTHTSNWY